jgi:hypothetical protein
LIVTRGYFHPINLNRRPCLRHRKAMAFRDHAFRQWGIHGQRTRLLRHD